MFDPSGRGGIALYTAHLADELRSHGVDVRVSGIAGQSRGAPDLPGLPWWERQQQSRPHFYAGQLTQLPRSAAALVHIAQVVEPHVIHLQTGIARRLDPLAIRLVRRRYPVVLTVHDPAALDGDHREEKVERRRWAAADGIIVHDQRSADLVASVAVDIPLFVVPPGLIGGATGLGREPTRRHLGWPESTPTILALGFIRPYKGFDLLSAAWADVTRRIPRARLVVAGTKVADVPGFDQLVTQAGVTAHTEWLSDDDVNQWTAAADLVVLPYARASHSGVLHRAVANGTPVLASPALGEEVERFRAGRVVPLEPLAWADAIVEALGVHPLPAPLPANDGMAEATIRVYRDIVDHSIGAGHGPRPEHTAVRPMDRLLASVHVPRVQ